MVHDVINVLIVHQDGKLLVVNVILNVRKDFSKLILVVKNVITIVKRVKDRDRFHAHHVHHILCLMVDCVWNVWVHNFMIHQHKNVKHVMIRVDRVAALDNFHV